MRRQSVLTWGHSRQNTERVWVTLKWSRRSGCKGHWYAQLTHRALAVCVAMRCILFPNVTCVRGNWLSSEFHVTYQIQHNLALQYDIFLLIYILPKHHIFHIMPWFLKSVYGLEMLVLQKQIWINLSTQLLHHLVFYDPHKHSVTNPYVIIIQRGDHRR